MFSLFVFLANPRLRNPRLTLRNRAQVAANLPWSFTCLDKLHLRKLLNRRNNERLTNQPYNTAGGTRVKIGSDRVRVRDRAVKGKMLASILVRAGPGSNDQKGNDQLKVEYSRSGSDQWVGRQDRDEWKSRNSWDFKYGVGEDGMDWRSQKPEFSMRGFRDFYDCWCMTVHWFPRYFLVSLLPPSHGWKGLWCLLSLDINKPCIETRCFEDREGTLGGWEHSRLRMGTSQQSNRVTVRTTAV